MLWFMEWTFLKRENKHHYLIPRKQTKHTFTNQYSCFIEHNTTTS